jgi:Winged helix-turn helix
MLAPSGSESVAGPYLIEHTSSVRYHPAHVSRLLQATGWSPQQPTERATQRNEAAAQAQYTEPWPAIKKGRSRRVDRRLDRRIGLLAHPDAGIWNYLLRSLLGKRTRSSNRPTCFP